MIEIVLDTISPSKLRMTTVQFYGVDIVELIDALNDRRLNFTFGHIPIGSTTLLVTSSNWESVCERWEKVNSYAGNLATILRGKLRKAIPQPRTYDDWHMPFLNPFDVEKSVEDAALHIQKHNLPQTELLNMSFDVLQKVSAARCLAVYRDWDFNEALDSYHSWDDRAHCNLMHAREHIQRPDRFTEDGMGWLNPKMHGHAEGWISFQNVAKFEEWRTAA